MLHYSHAGNGICLGERLDHLMALEKPHVGQIRDASMHMGLHKGRVARHNVTAVGSVNVPARWSS